MNIQRLRGFILISVLLFVSIQISLFAGETEISSPQLALDAGLPGEFDGYFVSDPCVLKVNGTYLMFYTGYGKDEKARIGLAESDDGINWIKKGVVLDSGILTDLGLIDLMEPCVLYEKDKKTGKDIYRMWYAGNTHEDNFIFYAESEDGKNWTQRVLPVYGKVNGEKRVREPWVIKEDNNYLMWYSDGENVNMLRSKNGIEWHYTGSFVKAGDRGRWTTRGIFSLKVFIKDKTKLFLCGGKDENGYLTVHTGEMSKDNRILEMSEEPVIGKDETHYKYGAGGACGMSESGKIRIWFTGINSEHPGEEGFMRIFSCEAE